MKIKDIKVFLVHDGDIYDRNWLLVKTETSDGSYGVGEAGLSGREVTVAAAIKEHKRYLLNKDPLDIEKHWQYMFRRPFFRGGSVMMAAISAIEISLWDIAGKHFGAPIYRLLGGKCRNKIKAYSRAVGQTPDELAEDALSQVKDGFKAIKFSVSGMWDGISTRASWINNIVEKVAKVRETVGEKVDIMVDCLGRTPQEAIDIGQAIEEYRPLFLEEPVPPENEEAIVKVAKKINIPIATGERLLTRFGFRRILELQAIDVIQPDLCLTGGILEGKKIAAMAESYYVSCAPHNPLSPVSTATAAHLDACIPNFLIQEYLSDTKPRKGKSSFARKEILVEPIKVENGYIKIPTKAGLGIEINEEAFEKYPYKPWDSLFTGYSEDGSLSNWPTL
jgi:galactonate dehydratase